MTKVHVALAIAGLFMVSAVSASDHSDVISVITRWNDLSNKGDEQGMAATCEKDAVVVDDLPPYVWRGADACADWQKSADAFAHTEGMTDIVGGLGKPSEVMITGGRGYVVIPATFAYTQGGRKLTEFATVTFTLKKGESNWLITSWVWSRKAIRPSA